MKVYSTIKGMLEKQLGYAQDMLDEELMLRRDLKIDSLDIIDLVVNIEDKFNIELFSAIDGSEDMTVCQFCEYIAEFVRRKVGKSDCFGQY